MRFATRTLLLLMALCLAASIAVAQVSMGGVQGTVKDPSGAVVPNATVTLTNTATGLARTATTNGNGFYSVNGLPPGTYTIKTTATGFNTATESIQVTVGSQNSADVTLGLAAAGTTVEVVGAGGVAVNTVNQEVSTVVNQKEIEQLPTLTRNPYDLVATSGNVTQDSQAGLGDARGAGFSINGQRSASTDVLLDGTENVDLFTATVGQQVPLDSVREFRVVTNGMTAQYGRASGGVVNVATKSGTNEFHGSAYEYNRISALAANTYENVDTLHQALAAGTCSASNISQCPGSKPHFTRNQFGFSVGGPIVKDKLFFFDNAEWIRVRSNGNQITLVPDPAFIAAAAPNTQAFFSTYGKLRPGLKTITTLTAADLDFTPGPGVAALPAGTPILDEVQYLAPGDAGAGAPQNTLMNVARIDFNLSDATQMFGRYSLYDEKDFAGVVNTSPYAGYETGQTNYDQNFLFSLNHTFTPNFLSNTRIEYNRLNNLQPLGTAPVGPTLYITSSVTATVNGHRVALPGYNEYTPGSAIPFGGPQNLAQFYEDLNWVHGNHTLRFGGSYIHAQDNRAFGAYEEAVEGLSRSSIPSGFDNFLAGRLSVFQAAVNPQGKFPCNTNAGVPVVTPGCMVTLPVAPPSFSRSNLYNDAAVYGQDSWKIFPRFTINLGLRWEYYGPQHNRNPQLDSNFYLGSGSNIFQQIRNGTVQLAPNSPVGGLWKQNWHNFAPNAGFAWDVFGNGKTSLRGGFGMGYERDFGNVTFNVIQNPPNYGVLALTPANFTGPLVVTTNNAGPLGGASGSLPLPRTSLRAVNPHIKTAYAEQWNLTAEQSIGNNLVASLGYAGSRGIHQYSISNINDPDYATLYLGDTTNSFLNTQYSAINFRGSDGQSWYNAMIAQLRGNIYKNLSATVNYTWSHTIDTLSSTFSDEIQNNSLGFLDPFMPSVDKGSADYDARHRVAVSLLWTLPFSNSSNAFVRNTIGGFQFAPIFTYHTGYPFTVFDCAFSGAFYNCPRADLLPGTNSFAKTGTLGPDQGNNQFNYVAVPAAVPTATGDPGPGEYTGPAGFVNSTLPTCTGLGGIGCSYPSNMMRRNSFVGPHVWNWDLGVYKNFKITERVGVQLRGEFFDLLNHKNYYVVGFGFGGAEVSSLPTNSAGLPIVQAKKGGYGNPFDEHRNTQLAIRFTF